MDKGVSKLPISLPDEDWAIAELEIPVSQRYKKVATDETFKFRFLSFLRFNTAGIAWLIYAQGDLAPKFYHSRVRFFGL